MGMAAYHRVQGLHGVDGVHIQTWRVAQRRRHHGPLCVRQNGPPFFQLKLLVNG